MSTPHPQSAPASTGYHHGDLPAALLAAAEAILEEAGIEGLTLRACARRAGVSHAAPAHHFGDVKGLLSAYAARSFADLGERMGAAVIAAGADPFTRLRASGLAYIAFAREKPGSFRLMFRCDRLDTQDSTLRDAADACYLGLTAIVAALLPEADTDTVQSRAVLAWSLVHGFTTLLLDGHFASVCPPGIDPGREDWLAEQITEAIRPVFETPARP